MIVNNQRSASGGWGGQDVGPCRRDGRWAVGTRARCIGTDARVGGRGVVTGKRDCNRVSGTRGWEAIWTGRGDDWDRSNFKPCTHQTSKVGPIDFGEESEFGRRFCCCREHWIVHRMRLFRTVQYRHPLFQSTLSNTYLRPWIEYYKYYYSRVTPGKWGQVAATTCIRWKA